MRCAALAAHRCQLAAFGNRPDEHPFPAERWKRGAIDARSEGSALPNSYIPEAWSWELLTEVPALAKVY